MQVLNLIKNNAFDPKQVAFIEEGEIPDVDRASGSSVKITEYEDEKMVFDADANGKNMLFIGTTYYPIGWKAKIDGESSEVYKLNHGFMGIVVPDGTHTVELVFEPSTYYTGKYITLTFNILIFAGLGFVFLKQRNSKKE
jgi:uncharacterized membrane protein YfhO